MFSDENADWRIVDLRDLRHLPLKNVDKEITDLVFGFDFWVIIGQSTAVTPIH